MPANTIEIDVEGHWNAVALMRRLDSHHSYLVQFAPEPRLVHAQCPGCRGERLDSAPAAIDDSTQIRFRQEGLVMSRTAAARDERLLRWSEDASRPEIAPDGPAGCRPG